MTVHNSSLVSLVSDSTHAGHFRKCLSSLPVALYFAFKLFNCLCKVLCYSAEEFPVRI